MERDISIINDFLTSFREKEAKNEAPVFNLDVLVDDKASQIITYFVPMLVENGFLREVPDHPDFGGNKCYRITWKGHCFLDLYRLAKTSASADIRTAALVAVTGFH